MKTRVRWFDTWHPALDAALQSIPQEPMCDHVLYRQLAEQTSGARKRIALVTERDDPVSVAILRQDGSSWVPATQWLMPGTVFPARPGYLWPAIEALGVDLWVAWWRMESEPPASRLIRAREVRPTHRMRCSSDPEAYWRATGNLQSVRRARRRCAGLAVTINPDGGAEWVIRSSDAKWRGSSGPSPEMEDRVLAAAHLATAGKLLTVALLAEDGRLVAGDVCYIHRRTMVSGLTYRDPAFDRLGVGIRAHDEVFQYSWSQGLDEIDLGSGYAYKRKWAPERGHNVVVNVCPPGVYRRRRAAAALQSASTRLASLIPGRA